VTTSARSFGFAPVCHRLRRLCQDNLILVIHVNNPKLFLSHPFRQRPTTVSSGSEPADRVHAVPLRCFHVLMKSLPLSRAKPRRRSSSWRPIPAQRRAPFCGRNTSCPDARAEKFLQILDDRLHTALLESRASASQRAQIGNAANGDVRIKRIHSKLLSYRWNIKQRSR
jgi:hypothetical protein